MNKAPYDLRSLEEWEEMLGVSNAEGLEKCMDWVHTMLRDLSDMPQPGGTAPEEWGYWVSLFLMAKREYARRGNEW